MPVKRRFLVSGSVIAPVRRKILLSAFMHTESSYPFFLKDFRATVMDATGRLREISSAASRQKSSRDDWSPIEILGHLIDSAANNHQRFVRAQFTDDLVFPGYEQEEWVSSQKYADESWTDLIQLWSSYNLHIHHLASVIPETIRTKPRATHNLDEIAFNLVDKSKATTLEYFIRDYVDHLRHHLDQIFTEQKQH